MADDSKPAFKDARTAKELLAQLRSDADLVAAEIRLHQSQFNLAFVATVALVATATLKSTMNFGAMAGFVVGGALPFVLIIVATAQTFLSSYKKAYASVDRKYVSRSIEESLESLLASQTSRLTLLVNQRDSIRIATVILVGYLLLIGLLIGWMGMVFAEQGTRQSY